MIEPIKLTASQIREMDETSIDKEANELTLKVALGFHANRSNELRKRERKWWDALSEIYGFEMEGNAFTVKRLEGSVCIVQLAGDE